MRIPAGFPRVEKKGKLGDDYDYERPLVQTTDGAEIVGG